MPRGEFGLSRQVQSQLNARVFPSEALEQRLRHLGAALGVFGTVSQVDALAGIVGHVKKQRCTTLYLDVLSRSRIARQALYGSAAPTDRSVSEAGLHRSFDDAFACETTR